MQKPIRFPHQTKITHADFGLKAVKDTNGEILEILCKIPVDIIDPLFSELELEISTRSTPHRFLLNTQKVQKEDTGDHLDELTLILSDYQKKLLEYKLKIFLKKN